MNIEEQISAFMDNALTLEEEAQFLHVLAVSPDKLELFHSHLDMRAAFVADIGSVSVPPALDAAVLGHAGLLPAPVPAAAPPAAWWTAGRGAVAALVGLGLFVGGWFMRPVPEHSMEPQNQAAEKFSGTVTHGTITPQPGGNDGAVANVKPAGPNTGTQTRIIYREKEPNTIEVLRIDTIRVPQYAEAVHDTVHRVVRDTVRIATIQRVEVPTEVRVLPAVNTASLLSHVDIEVQREHLNTWPYINYRRLGVDRAQQNMSISAAWNFDQNHAAGISFGEKAFAQEFYGMSGDSIKVFQQQPLLLYGSGFYRFTLPVTQAFAPQLTLQAGASSVGPVLGARLALRITPFPHWSMVLGGDASFLVYRFDGNMFTSHSLGLLYGVNYHF
jgi:hypothetical protein